MAKKESNVVETFVYISNDRIQVAIGYCGKDKVKVNDFYEERIRDGAMNNGLINDPAMIAATLRKVWDERRLSDRPVYLIVNGNSITIKPMRIPQTSPKNIPGLIRAEFKNMDNVDNLLLDYSVINPKNEDGTCTILAVLSPRDFVQSYVALFKEAGLTIKCIDLVQNSLIKLVNRISSLHGKTFALLLMDGNMLMQNLFTKGDYNMTRRSRINANIKDMAFERELGQAINTLIQFNKSSQNDEDISEVYLMGFPKQAHKYFKNYEQAFGITCTTFPEFTREELDIQYDIEPADYSVLLGGLVRYS